jgi:hypothetical protein
MTQVDLEIKKYLNAFLKDLNITFLTVISCEEISCEA